MTPASDTMPKPLDIDELLSRRLRFEVSYRDREVMLYQLALGYGREPMDEAGLRFVTEKGAGPVVMPTFATILAFGQRLVTAKDDFNLVKLLHGDQRIALDRPIPPEGVVVGEVRITDIIDKGEGRGAIVVQEIVLSLKDSRERLGVVTGGGFYRADGGRGGTPRPAPAPHPIPDRPADTVRSIDTRPDQALLYRLSGDRNPLHSDPEFARAAGFEKPILHGLCSYGIAARAVVDSYCPSEPEQMLTCDVRFSAPVYPGETIVTEMWRDGDVISFRCKVKERDIVVLNNGRSVLR